MSWEKISAIKIDEKNNKIMLKSHSNNDDATPHFWEFMEKKEATFIKKLLSLYCSWDDGDIRIQSKQGTTGKIWAAFIKFRNAAKDAVPQVDNSLPYEALCKAWDERSIARQQWINDNAAMLHWFITSKEKQKKYAFYLYGIAVTAFTRAGIFYGYGNAKIFNETEATINACVHHHDKLVMIEVI